MGTLFCLRKSFFGSQDPWGSSLCAALCPGWLRPRSNLEPIGAPFKKTVLDVLDICP